MKIVIHSSPQIEWQGRYARHAKLGLEKHGHEISITRSPLPVPCDAAMVMGPNMYQRVENGKSPCLMFNRKLIGNDPSTVHQSCALSWNGFNGDGQFCVDDIDPSRLESYLSLEEIEDWKMNDGTVHIIEQTNTGRSKKYNNLTQFYRDVKKSYSGPTILRKKPVGEENIKPSKIREELIKAKAVANLNSTISIEALVAGIPVVSFDKNDPAYAITGRNLNNLHYPENRLEFFQYLAHCQWTEQEIASGKFWEQLWPIQGPKLNEWGKDSGSPG